MGMKAIFSNRLYKNEFHNSEALRPNGFEA